MITADEAELGTLDPAVDAARIAFLSGRLASRHEAITALIARNSEMEARNAKQATRITELTTRNTELAALITSHETRIPELSAANDTLSERRDAHVVRAGELTTRNAELAVLVTAHETRIDELSDRNLILAEQLAQFEAALVEAEANCETVAMDDLYYLHADHLGRPQYATDVDGNVVWDMGGGVTPFGDSVNLAGAFAQQLMFPGQYADLETGGQGDDVTLSHNWHRTYDPTLGRYLQSDPIGLAGGLNRFAYVGGNPVGAVDPMGLKDRTKVKGQLVLDDFASILGWIRDTESGDIECGCDGNPPSDNSDVDFVLLPSVGMRSDGATTQIIKFYGTLTIHADGSRTNTGYDKRRKYGPLIPFTDFGKSNFEFVDYDWIVARGTGNKNCEKLYKYLPKAYLTPNTPERRSVNLIRIENGLTPLEPTRPAVKKGGWWKKFFG